MSSRPSRGAARLAAILDALPDGLLLVNCNGTVVNANTIALEMFETPGTALVGRGLLDLLPEFDSKLIPGSMRRPEAADERGRTKPTRMIARRTDGNEYPVEVTSASLEDGQAAYNDVQSSYSGSYTGDELLMLVVRDLSGTVDTEAELARSQRQTEMILRAASEGVVGTDTDGRVVLVNPAAAQILGFRASDLGGQELHPLILHSRAEGEPFPYEESPLADTLKSGRKHRVRGQVLWSKSGAQVPVDLTTAPVRDGDQLVGAVMTFTDRRPYEELDEQRRTEVTELTDRHTAEVTELTERHTAEVTGLTEQHAAELADRTERYASELEEQAERLADLSARHSQLTAVLGESLRGPLQELRGELSTLAADPAGQLWPEANQILHHLAAGYARMTTLVDNVLSYQRLDGGSEALVKTNVLLDGVVTAGIDAAVELIGPGRAQFAVHAPPIEAEVDAGRLVTALAHLVADVAGVDSTGKARLVPGGGYVDSTVVVAAAQRGDVVRIEVRGPFAGGDPVHVPIVRGIVRAHGGVLQTHEMAGMSGSAYVLEVPLGAGAGTVMPPMAPEQQALGPVPPEVHGDPGVPGATVPGAGVSGPGAFDTGVSDSGASGEVALPEGGRGRRRARRASTDAFLDSPVDGSDGVGEPGAAGPGTEPAEPTGRRRARREAGSGPGHGAVPEAGALPGSADAAAPGAGHPHALVPARPSEGSGRRRGRPSPAESGDRDGAGQQGPGQALALPASPGPSPSEGSVVTAAEGAQGAGGRPQRGQTVPPQGVPAEAQRPVPAGGHRAHRGGESQLALPAAVNAVQSTAPAAYTDLHDAPRPHGTSPADAGAPQAPAPAQQPTGRRARRALSAAQDRAAQAEAGPRVPFALPPADADRVPPTAGEADASLPGRHDAVSGAPGDDHTPPQAHPVPTGRRRARHADAPQQDGPGAPFGSPGQPGPYDPRDPNGPGSPSDLPSPPAQPGGWDTDDASGQGPAAAPGTPDGPGGDPELPGSGRTTHTTGTTPAGNARGADSEGLEGPAVPAGPDAHDGTRPRTLSPGPDARRQPLPAEAPMPGGSSDSTQGRAFSVRTLGQGVPFSQHIAHQQNQTLGGGGAGRRRKLAAPPEGDRNERAALPPAGPAAPAATPSQPPAAQSGPGGTGGMGGAGGTVQGQGSGQLLAAPAAEGRAYAIGAPDEGAAEGPEPLDGPGGAVEVANRPSPQPVDDELPPEPLDNPRRLLVWPAPDVSTQQALSDRGYRPVIVHSREEVDAQIAAFPAALFVDPLTGPITRKALQSLRQAAVAAEVPVLVTAGLGQASREAAYGADPAVLLKALAPRDSEQHPPRVLLIEENGDIALALTQTLERRGMQVACAATDSEAVSLATRMRPNLVVMDLMQVRRRRAGIVDWLRANGQLNRTPLVVYTSAEMNPSELPKLSSGETVLFLAERSTSDEVQSRIVDLLAKIGTN
ncbi:PAS domain-containing protein [Streptomyces sp. NBC_01257]|uniref:PAS domain-containing protein n=1 Tax=Streptomyces sp. NBC_01257 TaxID=2903799 RepID=UPI002DDC54AE|nr:PAS domain-containing protein [Streptomyces sp. NBC_01257]WRZ66062.1 PAS domain-containing protein [Streptomyces sp. NBC_01257]